jgi:hypothetical protein
MSEFDIEIRYSDADSAKSVDYFAAGWAADKNISDHVTHDTKWKGQERLPINAEIVEMGENYCVLFYDRKTSIEIGVFHGYMKIIFDLDSVPIQIFWRNDEKENFKKLNFKVSEEKVLEGWSYKSEVNQNYRDAALVKKFKESREEKCDSCGCGPGVYGKHMVWEVHHKKPIALGKRKTSKKDLALLCPNCHRAIHRSGKLDDIEQFQKSK